MTYLVADTLSCISVEEAKEMELTYLPQIIIFGDKSYRDDTEMDSETFIKRLKSSPVLPKTSAPNPNLYHPFFIEMVKTGEPILILCPSRKISGTVRSVEIAAGEFPHADIRIIDTHTIGSALGSIVRKAVAWRNEGASADEIEKRVAELSERSRTYFLVDTLEYLQKGGRIGAAQAVIGGMLQVKPILCIRNSEIDALTTERTHKKAMARFIEIISSECPHVEEADVTIEHGGVFEEAETLADTLRSELSVSHIRITYLPPAIMVHGGPGVLGVSFFTL